MQRLHNSKSDRKRDPSEKGGVVSKTVSVVIPTYNRVEDLKRLVKSICESNYPSNLLEVIIVDNAGTVPKNEIAKITSKIKLCIKIPGSNLYSNGARHLGAALARGDYIFFIDDDNVISKDCIKMLVRSHANDSSLGIAGPLMLSYREKNKIWCAGAMLNSFGLPVYLHFGQDKKEAKIRGTISDVDFFPNAFMVKKNVINEVPFNPVDFPHNWAESDFCLRVSRKGYKVETITEAHEWHELTNPGLLTRISDKTVYDQAKSRILFRKLHLNKISDWIKFWTAVFPGSSILYIQNITKQSSYSKTYLIRLYLKGTIDGLIAAPHGAGYKV